MNDNNETTCGVNENVTDKSEESADNTDEYEANAITSQAEEPT